MRGERGEEEREKMLENGRSDSGTGCQPVLMEVLAIGLFTRVLDSHIGLGYLVSVSKPVPMLIFNRC